MRSKSKSKLGVKLKVKVILILLILVLVSLAYYKNVYLVKKRQERLALTAKVEKNITIIPGWNIKQIDAYLKETGVSSDKKVSSFMVKDYSADYTFLSSASPKATLEGYLFPDTYRVYDTATADEAVRKMLNNFGNKVTDTMLLDIKKSGKSLDDIIIMASIVEKEVTSNTDMKIVAGIFWNRIKSGQALESCATLAYILGKQKVQYSYEDTRTDSPYNTYLNRGLPPGPIASPSLNAIMSAIYPTDTNYNYFLTRSDTGATVFSSTYAEHLKNKAKYLK